jgi:hypothetical protein
VTAIVDRLELERVTRLDLMLMQRFPTKAATRALRMLGRKRRYGGSSVNESNPSWQCLGGLEVSYSSGSTVTVRSGSALTPNPDPVTETRPAQYTPAPADADDDTFVFADLVANTNVAPASAIGAATTLHEWWIVYVTTELSAVETDPDRVVFNEGSGGAWVAASDLDKIKRWVLTPGVVRGAGGASLLTVAASVPADSVMIALISVPIGSTDLSSALFFDVRRIVTDPGPNMVSGEGSLGVSHESGVELLSPSKNTAVIKGRWWGRINDQLVYANTGPKGLSVVDIGEPSATWDVTATTTDLKIAWLYLTTVGDADVIPRPVRKGSSVLGTNTDEQCFIEGALVLSPTPPKMGTTDFGSGHKGHGKIDLRPSASLDLPNFTKDGMVYNYEGISTSHAICIGFALYDSLNDDYPLLVGPVTIDTEGWFRVGLAATADLVAGDGLLSSTALFDTISATHTVGQHMVKGSFLVNKITISGTDHQIPFTAINWAILANGSGLGEYWACLKPHTGEIYEVVTAVDVLTKGTMKLNPQNSLANAVVVQKVGGSAPVFTGPSDFIKPMVTGVRWPYNEPLAG